MILGFFDILKQFSFTRIDKNLVTMYVLDNLLWLGMGNLDSGESLRRFRRMLSSQHSEECYHLNIPRNVREDTG